MSQNDTGELSNAPHDTSIDTPNAMRNISEYQLNLLITLASGYERSTPILEALTDYYGERVNDSRYYSNISELVDRGYVEKNDVDDRGYTYQLTDDGETLLAQHRDRIALALAPNDEEATG